jgi:hypothetical protein
MTNRQSIKQEIRPVDRWLGGLTTLPVLLAFFFVGLGVSEKKWLFWTMAVGGWYLSNFIYAHLFRHFVVNRKPPQRALLCSTNLGLQLLVAIGVLVYVLGKYAT